MPLNIKLQRKKINLNKKKSNNRLYIGVYGVKALHAAELTEKHMDIIKNVLNKTTKKKGRLVVRCIFNRTITKKPLKIRMGKGKGAVKGQICQVLKGAIFLEFNNVTDFQISILYPKIQKRLPLKTSLIRRV